MKKIMILSVMVLLILVGCETQDFKGDVNSEQLDFTSNPSLETYLDKDEEIIKGIIVNPFGATGPKLAYANDEYAIILNYNGILVYNLQEKKIENTIDNSSLGLNKMQGEELTEIRGYQNYLAISNQTPGEFDKGNEIYIYNIEEDELGEVSNNELDLFKESNIPENLENIRSLIAGDQENSNLSSCRTENYIMALSAEVDVDTWELYILDKDATEIIEQQKINLQEKENSLIENKEEDKIVGYIYNFDIENNQFDFDEIEWITMEDTEKLEELGLVENDLSSGFYIHNENESLKQYTFGENTDIKILDGDNNVQPHKKVSFEEFTNYLSSNENTPFWITMVGEEVVSIEEQYIP